MSGELLREAAALMRNRAEAATHGPWSCDESSGVNDLHFGRVAVPVLRPLGTYGPKVEDVRHMAGMDPAVALAVADWLDDIAERHKADPEPAELVLHYEDDCPTGECEDPGYHTVTACWGCYPSYEGMEGRSVYPCAETKAALAVARAYLGGAS